MEPPDIQQDMEKKRTKAPRYTIKAYSRTTAPTFDPLPLVHLQLAIDPLHVRIREHFLV